MKVNCQLDAPAQNKQDAGFGLATLEVRKVSSCCRKDGRFPDFIACSLITKLH